MMFASTPERPRRSGATLSVDGMLPSDTPKCLSRSATTPGRVLLPPLSAMLSREMDSSPRPLLPSLNSFATPKNPPYMLPCPRSASTPSLATLDELAAGGATRTTPMRAGPNSSFDSDADISGSNDSMVKQSSKRKLSAASPSRDFAFISHSPATFPSQEPAIDNASLARRKRRRTSPIELAMLNDEFRVGKTPDKARRSQIAARVNMSEKAVQIWFQNKRQSLRRLKHSDKEVTELPPTPDTSSTLPSTASCLQATSTDLPQPPLYESTPIRPSLVKAESLHHMPSPAMAQLSPTRSFSASDLLAGPAQGGFLKKEAGTKVSLLLKMLASSNDENTAGKPFAKDTFRGCRPGTELPQLVMNLTNKKQPEFARQSAKASTQVRTFKLTPKERRPLAALSTNALLNQTNKVHSSKDTQCVQGLLSLSVGHQ